MIVGAKFWSHPSSVFWKEIRALEFWNREIFRFHPVLEGKISALKFGVIPPACLEKAELSALKFWERVPIQFWKAK